MVENIHNFFSSLPSLFVSNDVDFLKQNRIIKNKPLLPSVQAIHNLIPKSKPGKIVMMTTVGIHLTLIQYVIIHVRVTAETFLNTT
ncbi:unnamed protein product, partial [Vitis vinifera]|uniref:Uncharacterized protein n=1 Tax=Vitis vinifera TaxID=29760 RepID=D7SRK3_VITVI